MHKRGKLWSLALVPGIGALIVAAGALVLTRDRGSASASADKTVAIRLGELRSQAAEGRMLARERVADHVGALFAREHAKGLRQHIETSVEGLRDSAAPSSQAEAAREGLRIGATLGDAVQPLVDSAPAPDALGHAEGVLAAAARDLGRLQRRVEDAHP